MTKHNALLKYILFEPDETCRARLTLLRVSEEEFESFQRPVLWRVRLALPFRECELSPAELCDIAPGPVSQDHRAVAMNVIALKPWWPDNEPRLEQQRVVAEFEMLQRHLFHEEQEEPIGAFINRRHFERRNS